MESAYTRMGLYCGIFWQLCLCPKALLCHKLWATLARKALEARRFGTNKNTFFFFFEEIKHCCITVKKKKKKSKFVHFLNSEWQGHKFSHHFHKL